MQPWYIVTEKFSPQDGAKWDSYIKFSGLTQLTELVSLDNLLCTRVLKEVKASYWDHIVNEDCMLDYFTDLPFLLGEIDSFEGRNLLGVYRNPQSPPPPPAAAGIKFEFIGYDLTERDGSTSALTNCEGFPDAFSNPELSEFGLLTSFSRAAEVQVELHRAYPEEHHANCDRWAVFRALL